MKLTALWLMLAIIHPYKAKTRLLNLVFVAIGFVFETDMSDAPIVERKLHVDNGACP